jgi:hypothetical protein
MFHNNFWCNLEMDLGTGRLVEKKSLLPTPESLYRMCDPAWMIDHLQDDSALQLYAFSLGYIGDLDRQRIDKLASHLDSRMNWDDAASLRAQAGKLLDRYSFRATKYVLDKAREFTSQHEKKLMVVLFDPYRAMAEMTQSGKRYDQEIVDYLVAEKFNFFDMNEVHLRDYQRHKISFSYYMKQYFIGHYNPRGNHFFAFSIKDKIVGWLDPKPITYRQADPNSIDFKGYLPSGTHSVRRATAGGAASKDPE